MNQEQARILERWFTTYTAGFQSPDGVLPVLLKLKVGHSRRVARDMGVLAEGIGLGAAAVRTARMLGLLHDIGRFNQFADHGTFRDERSMDHGEAGRRVLAEAGVLDGCMPRDRARIASGVRHHNAKHVAGGLEPDVLTFVKLIRDADKLDIFDVLYRGWKSGEIYRSPEYIFGVDPHGPVSRRALAALQARATVSTRHIQSLADFFITQLSWMYDINYPVTYRLIRDRRVLDRVAEALPKDQAEVTAEVTAARAFVAARARKR